MAFMRLLEVELCKVPGVRLLRTFSGRVRVQREDGSEGWIEGMPAGTSDLLGIVGPEGWVLAVEVKAQRGRVSAQQARFLSVVQALGGIACVARQEYLDQAKSVALARTMLEALITNRRRLKLAMPSAGQR